MAAKPRTRAAATEPFVASAAFVRQGDRTPYSPGDRVGSELTGLAVPGILRPDRGPVRITRVVLRKSSAGILRARFRVHLFRAAPLCAVLDGEVLTSAGEISVDSADGYLGAALVPMTITASHGACGAGQLAFEGLVAAPPLPWRDAPDALFALVEALDHYSPAAAEVFTLELEGQRALAPAPAPKGNPT